MCTTVLYIVNTFSCMNQRYVVINSLNTSVLCVFIEYLYSCYVSFKDTTFNFFLYPVVECAWTGY